MEKVILLLVVLTIANLGHAADKNQHQTQLPLRYIKQYEVNLMYEPGTGTVTDELNITEIVPGEIRFDFLVFGSNAHTCQGDGFASIKNGNGFYLYSERLSDEDLSTDPMRGKHGSKKEIYCRLQIKFDSQKATLEEIDEKDTDCSTYCGMRAYIGKRDFVREK